jgi:hypothetical protein
MESGRLKYRLAAVQTVMFAGMPFGSVFRRNGVDHAAVFTGTPIHPANMTPEQVNS